MTIATALVTHICSDYIGVCFESLGNDVLDTLRILLKEAKYF